MTTRTGAYALLIANNHIFLTLQPAGPKKDHWNLPGGGIELNETPLQALHRELLEEAAFLTTDPTLLTTVSYYGHHNDKPFHYVGIVYRLHNYTPTDHTPQDTGQWFPLSSLSTLPITPFVHQLIEQKHVL